MAIENGGQINFNIGFNVNRNDIKQVQEEILKLRKMSFEEFSNVNLYKGGKKDLISLEYDYNQMRKSASEVFSAIRNSFNEKLGTLNLNHLNKELAALEKAGHLNNLRNAGAQGQRVFNQLSSAVMRTNLQLKETNSFIRNIGTTLGNTIKWSAASSAVNTLTGSIQRAWSFTKGLDTDLNNIRIVTNKSADEMERFARQANKTAQALGSSTRDYTQASLLYFQQGLEDEEVAARTGVTLKAANVTGQSTEEVSEQLTAVWNGYKVSAEETEAYVDKLAAVGANTASNLEELSIAMSKVASAANSAGVDFDSLNGILSTVISVTREAPETIGTAFKTIFARLGDLSLGGTDEDGVGLGNISGKLKELGVEVLNQEGEMRKMSDIITDVAAKWQTWTQAQRQAAAVAMAGKMQYSRLIALFDNWEMYTKALNTSIGALGTLQEQQDTYMDSTQAHLKELGTAWERVFNSMVDNKGVNGLIDVFTTLTNLIGNFTESLGGGLGVLLTFGSTATKVFNTQLASGLATSLKNRQGKKDNETKLNEQLKVFYQQARYKTT